MDLFYDRLKYKAWTWKHIYMLHWMINPGLAINELFLGQRIPKLMLVERDYTKRLSEKTFIPCPHCHTIHSSMKWTPQNKAAFGNWFGLYCDHCEKIIPCTRNITALALELITFPVWGWFRKSWKNKWLIRQKEKFSQPLILELPEYIWWKVAIENACIFFLIGYVWDAIELQTFLVKDLKGELISALMFGLFMSFFMKEMTNPKKVKLRQRNG